LLSIIKQRGNYIKLKRIRVIPILLIQKKGLVKSVKFKAHQYIGDPINTVKIFNEKEADEIVILDISATAEKRSPDFKQVKQLAGEAFMPLAYGGGITALSEIKELINAGVEKIILNNSAVNKPALIYEAAKWAGNQSIIVSMDVKKNFLGKYKLYIKNGSVNTRIDPVAFARQVEEEGAGEILLQDIDKDGSFSGYSLDLIKMISTVVKIPVVATSGAGSIADFINAVNAGASAVAAGSMFVLQRPHRAVLISYPSQEQLKELFFSKVIESKPF
jgi:imidazole glycerol-phosphate synthase subunit HisF